MMKDATNNEHRNSFVSYEEARPSNAEEWAAKNLVMSGELYICRNCDFVTFRKISGAHGYEQTFRLNDFSLHPVTPVHHRTYASSEEAVNAEPLWDTLTKKQKELYKRLYRKI